MKMSINRIPKNKYKYFLFFSSKIKDESSAFSEIKTFHKKYRDPNLKSSKASSIMTKVKNRI